MVERNLAKVEVESSRLFSRSRFQKGKPRLPFFVACVAATDRAVSRYDARLTRSGNMLLTCGPWPDRCAPMVKLVDTADLKSAAFRKRGVPVRPRLGAPKLAFKPSHTTSKPARCKAWRVFLGSSPGRTRAVAGSSGLVCSTQSARLGPASVSQMPFVGLTPCQNGCRSAWRSASGSPPSQDHSPIRFGPDGSVSGHYYH